MVNFIYSSNNLLEISIFPKSFREAIKKFRTKCVKDPSKEIFIKVQSIPYWEEDYEDDLVLPYHYVQLGIVKERMYSPSKSMPVSLEKKDLQEVAQRKMTLI